MNSLINIALVIAIIAQLCGCDNRPNRTLRPPPDAKWVNVTFRVPEGITLQPAELLYRSEKCKTVRYNSSNEPHDIPGYNDFEQSFSDGAIRQLRVAIDGGGACQWQLNSLRVSFRIADNHPLTKGKEVIETNYIFDFGDYGLSDGYGTGRAKKVSGNLDVKTTFFLMTIVNKMFSEISIEMFGGDTDYDIWSRRYRLQNTKKIGIEPEFYTQKGVILEGDDIRGVGMVITYPDESTEHVRSIKPDYQRLLNTVKSDFLKEME